VPPINPTFQPPTMEEGLKVLDMIEKSLASGQLTHTVDHFWNRNDTTLYYHETSLSSLAKIVADQWYVRPGHRQGGRRGNELVAFAHRHKHQCTEGYEFTTPIRTLQQGITMHVSVQLIVRGDWEDRCRKSANDNYQQAFKFRVVKVELRVRDSPKKGCLLYGEVNF